MSLSRRIFVENLAALAALSSVALSAARAGATTPEIATWAGDVDKASAALRDAIIAPREWQEQLNALSARMPIADLAAAIDFDSLASGLAFADKGVSTAPVTLPRPDGTKAVVFTKLFAVGKGRAVIPHGHVGMVSGHRVMKGQFHLRQYERIAFDAKTWTVKQTIDRVACVADWSTISDERNNVHWLIADEDSYTLDFIMAPVPTSGAWDVQNLDMDSAESVGDGMLRVPTMDVEPALAKYG